ncbi:MAG: PspA/IM30 family protein [Sphingomonadaceae bacterium]
MSSHRSLEVRSRLPEAKRSLMAAIADEQMMYQRYVESDREADKWRRRAELALSKGDEELARAALARAREHCARASQFQQQFLEQKGYVETMKGRLRALESGIAPHLPDLGRVPAAEGLWETDATETRARLAARAELERDELAEKLEALEREDLLERQLAELKRRMELKP